MCLPKAPKQDPAVKQAQKRQKQAEADRLAEEKKKQLRTDRAGLRPTGLRSLIDPNNTGSGFGSNY